MSSTERNVMVVGPGALGILFAARLGRRRSGVYLLDYKADRAAQLQDRGLHVAGATMADWTPPTGRVRADAGGWPVMDAVLFFVKAFAFDQALKNAAPAIGPRTALVLFSETLGLEAFEKRARQAVLALTDDRARLDGLGRVHHETPGDTLLDAGAGLAKPVLSLLKDAGIPAALDKNVAAKRWTTRLAQICVDVPAALTDAPQGRVLEAPLAPLGEKLLGECAALAKAMGKPVTLAALTSRRNVLISLAPQAKSPLGRDLLRGRPTERSFLLDPLLAAAKRKKTPAPLLSSLDRLLRRLEKAGAPIP